MADGPAILEELMTKNGLLDSAQKLGEAMYRLRWGSASVITTIVGESIVVIAPLFDALPSGDPAGFCRKLLELNSELGGTASFAIQKNGSVVLQVGRGVKGLDADEFGLMLATVGKFADDYDDQLEADFYS
ncbi:MAG: YbjN domain-containing protein [Deltaproteobacteria bacterium]|jgi:hypothetical protein|nr:YbjN domain-containing protein [Deltaproteobacteria bacterium]